MRSQRRRQGVQGGLLATTAIVEKDEFVRWPVVILVVTRNAGLRLSVESVGESFGARGRDLVQDLPHNADEQKSVIASGASRRFMDTFGSKASRPCHPEWG